MGMTAEKTGSLDIEKLLEIEREMESFQGEDGKTKDPVRLKAHELTQAEDYVGVAKLMISNIMHFNHEEHRIAMFLVGKYVNEEQAAELRDFAKNNASLSTHFGL